MLFDVTRSRGGAGAVVFLALLSLVQTGYSLRCDFCYDVEDCSLGQDVPTVVCDEESVQLTNSSLASFIPSLRSFLPTLPNQYECIHVRATSGSLECAACSEGDRCNNIPLTDDDDDDGGSLSGATVQRSHAVSLMSFFSVLALCLHYTCTVIMPFS